MMLTKVGVDVAIAYAVFAALGLFVSLMSSSGAVDVSVTLADLLSGHTGIETLTASSGPGIVLVLLATATVGVPYVWQHRRAALAFIVPLVVTLSGLWPLYEQRRARQDAIEALGELGRMMEPVAERMGEWAGSPLDDLGAGAYVLFATAVYLAVRGVMRAFGH